MNICLSCQAVNPDNYQFCQFCGTKIFTDLINTLDSFEAKDDKQSLGDTQPLNLENMTEEIEVGIEDFISSQTPIEPSSTSLETRSEDLLDPSFLKDNDLDFANLEIDIAENEASYGISSSNFLIDITYGGKTDVGKQRDRNEDDFATIFQTRSINGKSQLSDRSHRGVFILCDGMGGHAGGEEASAIAVNSITDQFRPFWVDTLPGDKKLREIISNANQAIFAKNEGENRQALSRMGTTLVMLAIHDLRVAIAHVGDSRIYKLSHQNMAGNSASKLEQITRDHDVFNQLIDLGLDRESALARPDALQLTQALGPHPTERLEPTINFFSLTEPTLFLLCSDGLCDNDVIEQNWQTHLLPILNQEVSLDTGLERLIDLGNSVNGHDNLTAVLVLCNVG
ncbi:protein phosphatase 2C domain-containing protein [Pseudanabaena sp. FACHB-1998]|uniref:protein phosphatase 2C domain-containing protein n=1 Tax=Pseudanabaena sp. FACHB-1998 TaxID=2692858 RepID=UPI0016802009|nr:protein phosphatase 2C domain-containing protein [Pseudanabaena sp. FACHB-1998]MBD2177950.1 protein phosphatase 2C domain-containing protein [Pseudanabaena sp. FACHB-1998]